MWGNKFEHVNGRIEKTDMVKCRNFASNQKHNDYKMKLSKKTKTWWFPARPSLKVCHGASHSSVLVTGGDWLYRWVLRMEFGCLWSLTTFAFQLLWDFGESPQLLLIFISNYGYGLIFLCGSKFRHIRNIKGCKWMKKTLLSEIIYLSVCCKFQVKQNSAEAV